MRKDRKRKEKSELERERKVERDEKEEKIRYRQKSFPFKNVKIGKRLIMNLNYANDHVTKKSKIITPHV